MEYGSKCPVLCVCGGAWRSTCIKHLDHVPVEIWVALGCTYLTSTWIMLANPCVHFSFYALLVAIIALDITICWHLYFQNPTCLQHPTRIDLWLRWIVSFDKSRHISHTSQFFQSNVLYGCHTMEVHLVKSSDSCVTLGLGTGSRKLNAGSVNHLRWKSSITVEELYDIFSLRRTDTVLQFIGTTFREFLRLSMLHQSVVSNLNRLNINVFRYYWAQ